MSKIDPNLSNNFIDSLMSMDDIFWVLSGLNKPKEYPDSKEINFYKNFFNKEKIKEIIKKSVDYRFSCIEELLIIYKDFYNLISNNNGVISHYQSPGWIYIFEIENLTDSAKRDRLLKRVGLDKIIFHRIIPLFESNPVIIDNYVCSRFNIDECVESNEARIYLKKLQIFKDSNYNIYNIAKNFYKLSDTEDVGRKFICFKHCNLSFYIDLNEVDIFTQQEVEIIW